MLPINPAELRPPKSPHRLRPCLHQDPSLPGSHFFCKSLRRRRVPIGGADGAATTLLDAASRDCPRTIARLRYVRGGPDFVARCRELIAFAGSEQ